MLHIVWKMANYWGSFIAVKFRPPKPRTNNFWLPKFDSFEFEVLRSLRMNRSAALGKYKFTHL